jgi:predicted nucleotidyltransferase component of viral defense system
VDLDFVPVSGDEIKEKESLKGCLSKKGFVTQRARHSNQFVVQSETTSVKIEIFTPDEKIAKIERHSIGGNAILVASLDDLLKMKSKAYSERKKDRDLFDVVAILRKQGGSLDFAMQLVAKYGKPEDIKELEEMSPDSAVFEKFREVLE